LSLNGTTINAANNEIPTEKEKIITINDTNHQLHGDWLLVTRRKKTPNHPSLNVPKIANQKTNRCVLDTSILSWNIRGTQNSNGKRQLKDMIRKHRPSFLATLETHVPYARLSTFWTNIGYTPEHIIEANGHSGGIWLLKHTAAATTTSITDYNQYSITFTISLGGANTTCTCVYASPNPTLRTTFWNYLSNLNHAIIGPWMLIGDFNDTLLPSEQRGGLFNRSRASQFSNFMHECNLLDLTTTGGRFTWHRNHNGLHILSKKLDRGIANINWRLSFPEAFVEVLCKSHSDHNPLLLRFGGVHLARGPRLFSF